MVAKTKNAPKPKRETVAQVKAAYKEIIGRLTSKVGDQRREIRAKFDAAQTFTGNELHWANTDNFDPHTVASYRVRRVLRARSRYEIIENNPYLKGTVLTLCNDFVGSGPSLQITDKRISPERRKVIELRWRQWAAVIKLRQKLWRMKMAKIVDGESFMRAYNNERRKKPYPVLLDMQVLEAERISSLHQSPEQTGAIGEIDGVRFDAYDNVHEYHILRSHPGGSGLLFGSSYEGDWVDAKFVMHWYRQDRGWLRGIPETTPSLPLCSILRRYTMATVLHKENAANFTAIISSEVPPGTNPFTDGKGNLLVDDPFDVFPIEMGMITNLPYGYKLSQLNPIADGVLYDAFVGSILREIVRPLMTPYNMASGSSKDANMSSGVLDNQIYKQGHKLERLHCEEEVLDPTFDLWFQEASRIPGYFGDDLLATDQSFKVDPLEHYWRWDRVGVDHTDPMKVAQALKILHDKRFITDRDVQEGYMDRDPDQWQEEITADDAFRSTLADIEPGAEADRALEEKKVDGQLEVAKQSAKDKAKALGTKAKQAGKTTKKPAAKKKLAKR